jgi:hypothetical protein
MILCCIFSGLDAFTKNSTVLLFCFLVQYSTASYLIRIPHPCTQMDEDNAIIDQLKADGLLGQFFERDFDCDAFVRGLLRSEDAVLDGASTSLEESPVERTLHSVRQRAGQLDVAIRDLVSRHQDALVSQATASAVLKQHIIGVHERVNVAEEGLRRIHGDILQPYNQLKTDAVTLRNVTLALEIMRKVQRYHQNMRRLRALAGTSFSAVEGVGPSAQVSPATPPVMDVRTMARVAPLIREAAFVSRRDFLLPCD